MELQKRDFRAMMYLHYRQGKLAVDSFQILHTIFGDQGPSKATIVRWFAAFKIEKTNLEDDPRTGRPASAVTLENIDAVERMIDEDRRVTYQQIQEELGIRSAAVTLVVIRWCKNGSSFPKKTTIFEPSFLLSTVTQATRQPA